MKKLNLSFKKILWSFLIFGMSAFIIKGQPSADFTYDQSGCAPDTVDFTNNSSGASSYKWEFGDYSTGTAENPTHVYNFADFYRVTLTAYGSGGDSSKATKFIRVKRKTGIAFDMSHPGSVCKGEKIEFSNYSSPRTSEFKWYFGDGDTSGLFNPSHAYSSSGKYEVKLIGSNMCGSDSLTKTIYSSDTATPSVKFNSNAPACPGESIKFYNQTKGAHAYKWYFGDGSTSTRKEPLHSYASTGSYDVKLIATSSCNKDSLVQTIDVKGDLEPSIFGYTNDDEACTGNSIQFSGGFYGTSKILWDFGDGQTSNLENPEHVYENPGTYNAVVTGENKCGNAVHDTVPVYIGNDAKPYSYFNLSPSGDICPGTRVHFTNYSDTNYSMKWDFGDGATSTKLNPVHTYSSKGTYTIALIVKNECGMRDTSTKELTVSNNVVGSVSFNSTPRPYHPICQAEEIDFTITESSQDSAVHWDFGDGTTSTEFSPSHTFSSSGTYTVELTDTNKCGNINKYILDFKVTDNMVPQAQFYPNKNVLCEGEKVTIFNSSSSPKNSMWYFGDGDTSSVADPEHVYTSPGDYDVKLLVSNACGTDSITKSIMVKSNPSIYLGEDSTLCTDESMVLDAGSGYDSYYWNQGSATQQITADTSDFGTGSHPYTVEVTDDGCSAKDTITLTYTVCIGVDNQLTEEKQITVYPNPANENLMMQASDVSEEVSVQLLTMKGKVMFSTVVGAEKLNAGKEFSVSELKAGTYILKIKNSFIDTAKPIIIK